MKRPRFSSLQARLAVSYLVALLLLGGGLLGVRWLVAERGTVEVPIDSIRSYLDLLVDQIGTPPNAAVVSKLERQLGLEIQIAAPGQPLKEAWLPHLLIERDSYRFLFGKTGHEPPPFWALALSVLFVALAALTTSYLISRRLLLPLSKMSQVALQLGVKDWKARVNLKGNDELATTARAIDQMAERIEHHMTSVFDFLATVSHELRSPLSRMRLIQTTITNAEVADSMLEEIQILETLTSQLLEQRRLTTQPGSLTRGTYPVDEWARLALNAYTAVSAPVTLDVQGQGTAVFDRKRMDMALRNLVDNALKYAPGSPVAVRVARFDDGAFEVEVRDGGPGMDPRLIAQIGEPFLGDPSRTGARTQGGFGLGLSIVQAVVDAHHGTLRAENLVGGGFSVCLELPGR